VTAKSDKSQAAFDRARRVLVGGVNSPVRAFAAVGGAPPFAASAKGAYITDIDGNRYVDYVGSYGPAILGHAPEPVTRAITEATRRGTSYGAPTEAETALAEAVIDAFPSIEKVRFVNSGTEAVMTAIRLARGVTGRAKIVKFVGCYHGHADPLLVSAGSGATTLGVPSSPGVPAGATADTLPARYNDLDGVGKLLAAHAGQVAAVLVEPVAGNMGVVPPAEGFLQGLRALCKEAGALLIFDEVMTGFRVAPGGAQGLYRVKPDLTTLGKIIGGGMPVGAVGGPAEIMSHLAPEGPVYQAGTLSGNPVAMSAGLAAVAELRAPGFYEHLERTSAALAEGLRNAAEDRRQPRRLRRLVRRDAGGGGIPRPQPVRGHVRLGRSHGQGDRPHRLRRPEGVPGCRGGDGMSDSISNDAKRQADPAGRLAFWRRWCFSRQPTPHRDDPCLT